MKKKLNQTKNIKNKVSYNKKIKKIIKTARQKYTSEALQDAKNAIQEKKMSIRKAAEVFGVPKSTLSDASKSKYKSNKMGRNTTLDTDIENLLVTSMISLASWGFGLELLDLQIIIRDYLIQSGIKTIFKNSMPGRMWFSLFRKRHPEITVRVAQNFPLNRAEAMSPKVINDFFEMCSRKYNELDLCSKPHQIFNADETGFTGD